MIVKITNSRAGVDIILLGNYIRFLRKIYELEHQIILKQNSRISGPNPADPLTHSVNIKIYYVLDDSNNEVYYKSFTKYIFL